MQTDNIYQQFKAGRKVDEPFKYKLNQPLAKEILKRADGCRPPHPKLTEEISQAFKTGNFVLQPDKEDYILIDYKSDQLVDGRQRLAGFVKSKIAEYELEFIFIDMDKSYNGDSVGFGFNPIIPG